MVSRVYSGGVRRSRMSTAMTPASVEPGIGTTVTSQDGIGGAVRATAAALGWVLWHAGARSTSARAATTMRGTVRPREGDNIELSLFFLPGALRGASGIDGATNRIRGAGPGDHAFA